MRKTRWLVAAGFSVFAGAQLFAHHGADQADIYKGSKPITLQGTIVDVEWFNPHAFLQIDVKDAAGTVTRWRLELASPNALTRQGLSRESLKRGAQISVIGTPAKDGVPTPIAYARTITLADGRKFVDTAQFSADGKTIKFVRPTK